MDELLVKLIEGFGVGMIIPVALLVFLWRADDVVQPAFKDRFAAFLLTDRRQAPKRQIGYFFVEFFDDIFGKGVFTIRFILRSFIVQLTRSAHRRD